MTCRLELDIGLSKTEVDVECKSTLDRYVLRTCTFLYVLSVWPMCFPVLMPSNSVMLDHSDGAGHILFIVTHDD